MTRAEIIAVFEGIADIWQIKGDDPDQVLAYRKIAKSLAYNFPEDFLSLYEQNKLTKISGIGSSTMEKILELLETGSCQYYEDLKASVPSGVLDLMSISGVGPSTAARLYHELNIDSLESLQQAIDAQKLRNIKGMGKKTEEKLSAGLKALLRHKERRMMGYVLPTVKSIVSALQASLAPAPEAAIAGELRRWTETIKDAQILVAYPKPDKVLGALKSMECVKEANLVESGVSAVIAGDVKLNVNLTSPQEFGAELIRLTGSEGHIAKLNARADELSLEPIFPASWAKGKSEEEIYASLSLPFIVPEIREDTGEIQSALSGQLPSLLNINDIRGDLHIHSTWSDGHESIEVIAETARSMGYEYISICDHSVSSKIANGLDIEQILNKMINVREINERIAGIEILMGAEVDILKDGSLDYPDNILEKLDVVIASVHSGFNMDESAMTARIITAIENKFVHIIGHPTGRLLCKRDPYQVNIDAIINAAAENGKSFELNAYPDRLDLKDTHIRKAKERGVMITINTDAHSVTDLGFMMYGVYTARRGWAEKTDVLNTLSLVELMEWLYHRKHTKAASIA